jgi:hypothetical protein
MRALGDKMIDGRRLGLGQAIRAQAVDDAK